MKRIDHHPIFSIVVDEAFLFGIKASEGSSGTQPELPGLVFLYGTDKVIGKAVPGVVEGREGEFVIPER